MVSRAMTADADLRELIAAAEAFDSDYEGDQMPAYTLYCLTCGSIRPAGAPLAPHSWRD